MGSTRSARDNDDDDGDDRALTVGSGSPLRRVGQYACYGTHGLAPESCTSAAIFCSSSAALGGGVLEASSSVGSA